MDDASNELEVAAQIQTVGGWLNLQDPANGYEIDATSFANRSVTHRKVEANSGWMEGTFTTRSVRENISETLAVQVWGDTESDFDTRLGVLTDALEQLSYQVIVSFGVSQQIWDCTVADYAVSTTKEFKFAKFGIVTATVPRLPTPYVRPIVPGSLSFWVLGDPELSFLGETTILL